MTHTHTHTLTHARARGISGGLSNVKGMMANTVRDLREEESFITRPRITRFTYRTQRRLATLSCTTHTRIFKIPKTRTNFVTRSTDGRRLGSLPRFFSSYDRQRTPPGRQ